MPVIKKRARDCGETMEKGGTRGQYITGKFRGWGYMVGGGMNEQRWTGECFFFLWKGGGRKKEKEKRTVGRGPSLPTIRVKK